MDSVQAQAFDAFARLVGHRPGGVWCAPGRVNLIGEHTDYNDGLVLPMAIDRSLAVAAGLRRDGRVRCASLQASGVVDVDLGAVGTGAALGWAAPLLGALWAMRAAGVSVPGADLVVASDVPLGAGLASSAALEVAGVLALAALTGRQLADGAVAGICREGETVVAGAATGPMDQLAVLCARADHAMALDCRTLQYALVPFAPQRQGATLLVVDTTVAHDNRGAGYASRRQECAAAAAALGVASLRDATAADLVRLDGVLQRRARHVVTENLRVLEAVSCLRGNRLADLGPILTAGHRSLRDDFEVSSPELDCVVESALDAGAWGARLTGAGFGGSVIVVVAQGTEESVGRAVRGALAEARHRPPHVHAVVASDGAAVVNAGATEAAKNAARAQ